jgi:acetyl esterase
MSRPLNIDPELEGMLHVVPALPADDVGAARAAMRALLEQAPAPEVPDGLAVEDIVLDGPDGDPLVLRVYRPGSSGPVAALVHFHGGGFVLGDLDTEHAQNLALAAKLGIAIVSVDYRLAPEHPFPAGMEDCYRGRVWTAEHARDLGVDPARLGVYGQSAGGALAAACAIAARDRSGPPLRCQVLVTPVVDDRCATPSMRSFDATPLWSRPQAEASWRSYLGGETSEVSGYAAPMRATDLADLPPAYLSTAENDPLRDEGIYYALALLQAGVSVELHHYPGTFHGSTMIPADVSRRQTADLHEAIRRGLGA